MFSSCKPEIICDGLKNFFNHNQGWTTTFKTDLLAGHNFLLWVLLASENTARLAVTDVVTNKDK